MEDDIKLYQGDSLEAVRQMPDGSVDLVLTDPPYNIGLRTQTDGRRKYNDWDRVDDYISWCISWLQECQRVLKPNGVLYFWHNDMTQIADLLIRIKAETNLKFVSFCIWDKGSTYRAMAWHNRRPDGKTAPRSWFNVCEYCLHFFNNPKVEGGRRAGTGLDRINSSPESYRPIKDWYAAELKRLGLTKRDIAAMYTKATGKKPHMLRHYFENSQFEIPMQAVWESVYMPLGFGQSYEELRQPYEEQRNTHICDPMHCNIWHEPPIPSNKRYHTCQKPTSILGRLINVSSRPGGIVFDPFMGSGSTGVACLETGRKFIGGERDERTFNTAQKRIADYKAKQEVKRYE